MRQMRGHCGAKVRVGQDQLLVHGLQERRRFLRIGRGMKGRATSSSIFRSRSGCRARSDPDLDLEVSEEQHPNVYIYRWKERSDPEQYLEWLWLRQNPNTDTHSGGIGASTCGFCTSSTVHFNDCAQARHSATVAVNGG